MLLHLSNLHQLPGRLLPVERHLPALPPHMRHLLQRLPLPVLRARLLPEQQLLLCVLVALPDLPRELYRVCQLPHRLPPDCHVHLHSVPARLPRMRPHRHLLRLLVWVHQSKKLFCGNRRVLLHAMSLELPGMHQ